MLLLALQKFHVVNSVSFTESSECGTEEFWKGVKPLGMPAGKGLDGT